MNLEDFIRRIEEGLALMGLPSLSRDRLELLFRYFQILQKWNQKLNLTAHRNEEESIEKNFLDSMSLIPHLFSSKEILDVGSGAGFPGLVLKISLPESSVILVEPIQKKSAFLSTIIRELNLNNVEIKATRLEESNYQALGFEHRFDAIVSRATISIEKILPIISPCLKLGGVFIGMASGEFSESENCTPPPLLKLEREVRYQLPLSKINRKLILFQKQIDKNC